jgi:hypothetical protein
MTPFLLLFALAAAPLEEQLDFPAKAACRSVPVCRAAAELRADDPALQELAGCSSEALYYGMRMPRDDDRARRCALAERARGDGAAFGGSAVLMMIYANGRGVPADFDCAASFACAVESAQAELEGRLRHIERLRRAMRPRELDLCDDVTSGFMMGHCAAHRARIAEIARAARLESLTAHWSPQERTALRDLVDATQAFVQSRGDHEVDLSGTARSAWVIEEQESLWNAWLASLQRFESGRLPRGSERDRAAAERALQARHDRLESRRGGSAGTVTFEDIQATQKVWLTYRDAWIRFGRIRYPAVSEAAWGTWAARARLRMLNDLARSWTK